MKLTLLGILTSVILSAQRGPLNDQHIMTLCADGVSTGEILRIVASAPQIDFNLAPASTDAMLKAGVSEEIIKAMAARESGSSASAPTSRRAEPIAITSKDWTLHEGTPVRMRIMRTVSSGTAHEGDNVDFETLDDISVNGMVVIPRNSTALATVTVAESKKSMGRGGKLGMNIDYVRLPSGEKLALRGVESLKGGGHVGAMTGAMVATAIVFWPAAPVFLFIHGKDISIPEGHEVTVYTNSDYRAVASSL